MNTPRHAVTDLLTLPQVAKRLGVTPRRIEWAIRRSAVEPVCRVGIIRLYGQAAVEQIAETLRDIAQRRELTHA